MNTRWILATLGVVVLGGFLLVTRGRSGAADAARPDGAQGGEGAGKKAGGPSGPAGPARITPVLVAPVARRDVPLWIEGLGTVSAWQQVTVKPQVDGRLDAVFFKEGQHVKRGQVLAQIDPRPFNVQLHTAQANLARDRAQLDGTKKNLVRNQELRKTNLVAQQAVDDLAASVGQLEGTVAADHAAIESARLNLGFARVTAPLDGVLGVRLVDAGNVVHAADATGLVVITQLDPAAVFFTVPEDELPRIAAAQARGPVTVEAWSRDGSQRIASGLLVVVDNQINQATATLKLKARFSNPGHALWPNEFVKARLLVETRKDALVVPAAAVQRGPQGSFVYVLGDPAPQPAPPSTNGPAGAPAPAPPPPRKADLRNVEVVLVAADVALLKGGVSPGEQVVIEGQSQLRPGALVSTRSGGGPAK